jgi:phosphatidylglycerophosphate synthase
MKIYSKFEYKNMIRFQLMKDNFLMPITNVLSKLHISANLVSVFSGIIAMLSFFLAVKLNNPLVFVVGIWVHLFLDGLDGSLARLSRKKPEALGLVMDIFFDSVGIIAVGCYALYFNYISILTTLVFIASYLGVNVVSYLLARIDKEYDFVIRPRIYILTAIVLDYVFSSSITPIIIAVSNVLLIAFFLIGIKKLFKI